jgi:AcrR family transcriptional regulator
MAEPLSKPALVTTSETIHKRVADSKRRVCEVAARQFNATGYDAVSIESIATEAGIARSTFYRFFQCKEDVVRHMVVPVFHDALNYLEASWSVSASAPPVNATTPTTPSHSVNAEILISNVDLYRWTQAVSLGKGDRKGDSPSPLPDRASRESVSLRLGCSRTVSASEMCVCSSAREII